MGTLDALVGRRVYLDANAFIYVQEHHPTFGPALEAIFAHIDARSLEAVTSELTLAECLVKPIAERDAALVELYHRTLRSSSSLAVVPIYRHILVKGAELRASYPIRLPDAIHVATAITTGCTSLLTNDSKLQSLHELRVIVLSQTLDRS